MRYRHRQLGITIGVVLGISGVASAAPNPNSIRIAEQAANNGQLSGPTQALAIIYTQNCKGDKPPADCDQKEKDLLAALAKENATPATGNVANNSDADESGPCPNSERIDPNGKFDYRCRFDNVLMQTSDIAVQGTVGVGSAIVQAKGQSDYNKLMMDTQGSPKQSEFYQAAGENLQSAAKIEQGAGAISGAVAGLELVHAAKRYRNAKTIEKTTNAGAVSNWMAANNIQPVAPAGAAPGAAPAAAPATDSMGTDLKGGDSASAQNNAQTTDPERTKAAVGAVGADANAVDAVGKKAAQEQRDLGKQLLAKGLMHMITSGAMMARSLMDKNAGEEMKEAAEQVAAMEAGGESGFEPGSEIPTATLGPIPTGNPIALPGFNPGADNNPNSPGNQAFGPSIPTEEVKEDAEGSSDPKANAPSLGSPIGGGAVAAASTHGPVKDEFLNAPDAAGAGSGGGFSPGGSTAKATPEREGGDTERAQNAYLGTHMSAGGGRRGGGGGDDSFAGDLGEAFKALLAQQQKEADGDQKSILDYGRKPASEEESLLSAEVNIFERISATYREKQLRGAI